MTSPFCNVALPVPLRTTFTYAIPESLKGAIQPGSRILVPFRKKSLVGVVVDLTDQPPANVKLREIARLMEFAPALTPKLIELAQWIANYYLAPIGEVFRSMLPPITELKVHREIALTPSGRAAAESLGGGELSHGLTTAESALLQKVNAKNAPAAFASAAKMGIAAATLQQLQQRGLIEIHERLSETKRKSQTVIAWKSLRTEEGKTLREKEEKVRALLESERGPLPLPQLLKLAQVSRSLIDRMLAGGFLESWEEPIDPAEDPFDAGYTPPAHALNAEQESAMKAIRARFELGEFGVQLLHGVTGSGKTEVYLRAVQDTLARGKTALVLVPEIALTLWIGRQCRAWFGAKFEGVAVLHSALSDTERAREWWRVRNGDTRVVVGTRSAVFAPLQNLGLIIVDEEQENSFNRRKRRATTGATSPSCAPRWRARWRCWGRRRHHSKLIITRATENMNYWRWLRVSKIARWRASKSWICARIFSRRTRRAPFPPCCTLGFKSAWRGAHRRLSLLIAGAIRGRCSAAVA